MTKAELEKRLEALEGEVRALKAAGELKDAVIRRLLEPAHVPAPFVIPEPLPVVPNPILPWWERQPFYWGSTFDVPLTVECTTHNTVELFKSAPAWIVNGLDVHGEVLQ